MARADVTANVLEAKRRLGLTWKTIAEALGEGSPVFYTVALLDHQSLNREEARKAGALLQLGEDDIKALAEAPEERGSAQSMPPSDPLIYRFYELVQGYGPALKALINEELPYKRF